MYLSAALVSLAAYCVVETAGHGMLTLPSGRNGGTLEDAARGGDLNQKTFNTSSWFSVTTIPGLATNCGEYVTAIPCGTQTANTDKQPWRGPGTAPVFSPCGGFCVNDGTGSPTGCKPNQEPDDQWTVEDGVNLPKTERTHWTAGSTAKVGFAALYNHGQATCGGYSYRLCPAAADQTEACFQKTTLDFATETSTIHWTNGKEAEISALTMANGTFPAGSQWRAMRIPACSTMYPSICGHELLPPPCDRCCAHNCDTWHFSVVDEIKIPATLPNGEYTLSWRWDGEINAQVWANCADVVVGG